MDQTRLLLLAEAAAAQGDFAQASYLYWRMSGMDKTLHRAQMDQPPREVRQMKQLSSDWMSWLFEAWEAVERKDEEVARECLWRIHGMNRARCNHLLRLLRTMAVDGR